MQLRELAPVQPAPLGPQFSDAENIAMQRAMVRLADRWGLTSKEAAILLGGISPRTFGRWKSQEFGDVGPDLAARLSNLMAIHKALRLLFKDPSRGYSWIKKNNTGLGGQTALDVMLGGNLTDIMRVRRLLDAQRAPW